MRRRALGVMADDAPGIVAQVIDAIIVEKRWAIGEVWAETRFGSFFLAVVLESDESDDWMNDRICALQNTLESSTDLKVVASLKTVASAPEKSSDFVGTIEVEGARRVHILQEVVNTVRDKNVSIVAIRTEEPNAGALRYVIRAAYGAHDRSRMKSALQTMSKRNSVKFVKRPEDRPTLAP